VDTRRADEVTSILGQLTRGTDEALVGELAGTQFAIVSGNSLGTFHMDVFSGQLSLVARLDYETQPVSSATQIILGTWCRCTCCACRGAPTRSRRRSTCASPCSTRTTTRQPSRKIRSFSGFSSRFYDLHIFVRSVSERERVNRVVWTFNASDLDSAANGRVMYDLVEVRARPLP